MSHEQNSEPAQNRGRRDSSTEESILFRGTVSRVTYQNSETGFCVLQVTPEAGAANDPRGQLSVVTVVGVAPEAVQSGRHIVARGYWKTHPKFGRQFSARSISETAPTTPDAIERYLGSGVVPGLGPALAKRIVEAFGAETLEVIDKSPRRLQEIHGIGDKKLEEILSVWDEKKNLRETMLFFQTHNLPASLAQRIYKAYGGSTIEKLTKNPYILSRDLWGIGFITADKIAQAVGIQPESPLRILAGLHHTLKKASDDGHCYLPREVLLAKTSSLLGIADEQLLGDALHEACTEGSVLDESGNIYLPHLAKAEQELAARIALLIGSDNFPAKAIDEKMVESAGERAVVYSQANESSATPQVIRLSCEQRSALRLAAERALVVVTGGPGCGKTTVVRTIAGLFRQAGLTVRLAAPTGKAAQRLSEVCDIEASTIHRMLKYDPMSRGFLHDEKDPLVLDALIVDEASMIDMPLATSLLKALPPGARIVVVGDVDQLPSVGPGLFLADLLGCPETPRVSLSRLFRRENESAITSIAHQINNAVIPEIPEPDGRIKTDAYFIRANDILEAAAMVERLVTEQIPKAFGFKQQDITVLSPMNQGDLGIIALNKRLQQRFVPERPDLPRVSVGNTEFRVGDRVCQRVNNYNIVTGGVFNGDQGEVVGIDSKEQKLWVKLWDGRTVEYSSSDLYQLDLAYALTIHRSQGSEVPVIVLALHDSHNILLERQLIYTAVTRAKQLLIIVGSRKALALATKRSRSRQRYSGLQQRLQVLMSAGI